MTTVLGQLQSLNDILSNFIKSISFDEFIAIFATTIDEAVNKINEFKSALELDAATAKFESQITQLQDKIRDLQTQIDEKNLSIEQNVGSGSKGLAEEIDSDVLSLEEIKQYKQEISELEKENEHDLQVLAKSYDDIRGKRKKKY